MAGGWFLDNVLVQSLFCRVQHPETDVRSFLHHVNRNLGEHQLVFSLEAVSFQVRSPAPPPPPVSPQVEGQSLPAPTFPGSRLWADFSLGPGTVSVVCSPRPQEGVWQSGVTIPQDLVLRAATSSVTGALTLHLFLSSAPLPLPASAPGQQLEAQLVFPAGTELLPVLGRMFGDRIDPTNLENPRAARCSRSAQDIRPRSRSKARRKASTPGTGISLASAGAGVESFSPDLFRDLEVNISRCRGVGVQGKSLLLLSG